MWHPIVVAAAAALAITIAAYDIQYRRSMQRRRAIPAPRRLAVLTELLRFVNDAAVEGHHLHPFLLYGTLLGWARHRDFICYDFDVDLGVLDGEYAALTDRLRRRAPPHLTVSRRHLPLFGIDCVVVTHTPTGLNADLFRFRRVGPAHLARCTPSLYDRLYLGECTSDLPEDWILPLTAAQLRGVPVWVPHRPHCLLRCHYGDRYLVPDHVCDDPVACTRCHRV